MFSATVFVVYVHLSDLRRLLMHKEFGFWFGKKSWRYIVAAVECHFASANFLFYPFCNKYQSYMKFFSLLLASDKWILSEKLIKALSICKINNHLFIMSAMENFSCLIHCAYRKSLLPVYVLCSSVPRTAVCTSVNSYW